MNKTVLLFCFILGLSLICFNLNHYINSPSNNNKPIYFIIPKGYSVKKIADELEKQKVINHPNLFWITHRFFFKNCPLQAGEYEIPAKSSIRNLIQFLNEGKVVIHKFAIAEGSLIKEIINKIQDESMLVGEITKKFNEGDFLADTYFFTYNETKMTFINRICTLSQHKIGQLWENRAAGLPFKDEKEAVTLASIIEKETGLESERRRVAGVFINRLKKNMRLQADPTVIYAITLGQVPFSRSLTRTDLKIISPYNTYLNKGLPPTPICTPGAKSLEAALNPLISEDLYFVVDGKGSHNFSTNLNDHNQHVSNYKKLKMEEKKDDN